MFTNSIRQGLRAYSIPKLAASRSIIRMSSTVTPITSANAPPAAASYSHAIKANGFIYVSGQIPYTKDFKPVEGSIQDKAEQALHNVVNIVKDAGSSIEKIVKINIFLTDMNDFQAFNAAYAKFFTDYKPARSCVAVKELPLGVPLEVEAIAVE